MNQDKIKIAILCGGKSAEHEVSLQSAQNIFQSIDTGKYQPILIGIDKKGQWFLHHSPDFLANPDNMATGDLVMLPPASQGRLLNLSQPSQDETIDVVFPILHGPGGEDGTVQGLLQLADIPYVGSAVLGSAAGMDKDMMKRLLREAKLPVPRFMVAKVDGPQPDFIKIKNNLGLPVFIKPANMGSSIGVSKASNQTEYELALSEAFKYDTKVIIEEYVPGRELECAVLGNEQPQASVVGEVLPSHEFYSYEAKYLDQAGAQLTIPAQISAELAQRIQTLAVQTFQVIGCHGLGRVDFFLKDNQEIFINEINTLPGFTQISMYPKLWQASGLDYAELIDRLVQLALDRFAKEQKLQTNYL